MCSHVNKEPILCSCVSVCALRFFFFFFLPEPGYSDQMSIWEVEALSENEASFSIGNHMFLFKNTLSKFCFCVFNFKTLCLLSKCFYFPLEQKELLSV